MEIEFMPFALLCTSILLALAVTKAQRNSSKSRLPPGPWKLPVFGNLHQLSGALPHRTLTTLARKYGPLMHLQLGEISTVVVSSSEIAREVLKTHDLNFAQRTVLLAPAIVSYNATNVVFSPYGDYWRYLRKICTVELLSPKRVLSFRSIREAEVGNLVRKLCFSASTPINLSQMLFSLMYGITSQAAFGKKYKDQREFESAITQVSRLATGFGIADLFPSIQILQFTSGLRRELEKQHQIVDGIMETIINEHKRQAATNSRNSEDDEQDDIVDVLLKIQANDEQEICLSNDNIKAVILDMFSAGSETSATTVEWIMSELLKNPSAMKKAQNDVRQIFKDRGNVIESGLQDLKFLKSVIKETLRLHPPVTLIPRECRESVTIAGYPIPVKTRVLTNTWAIGRDPKIWNEADRFCPERFLDSEIDYKGTDFELIPFGSGRRICPGISYAIANIELPLAQLLYHFDWELPGGQNPEELKMTENYALTSRREEDLVLICTPHHYSSLNVKK